MVSPLGVQASRQTGTPPPLLPLGGGSFGRVVSSHVAETNRVRVDGRFFARGAERWRAQGVTYGPFAPGRSGEPFPSIDQVRADLATMQAVGVNALRTYHTPPAWFWDLADETGLAVLCDAPWRRHHCFLDQPDARSEARRLLRGAAEQGRGHPSLLAYSIGNEIPPDIVRWHGAKNVERFLAELADVARQADPDGLVTYASFPSTEYLELPWQDFATFNVYLHDALAFRRYLLRLQNLAGDKPLLLGEMGMDTLRHGEEAQAEFLTSHLRETTLAGLAGAFVFSWTDDWYTGGLQMEDWAFGLTRRDRTPKASYHALARLWAPAGNAPITLLDEPCLPRVSVVVCAYNAAATLEQCLDSLRALRYPDYEMILVDDGSTDDTPALAARFPDVRTIRQRNQGLSAARNAGLQAATGTIVAYTDADCFADPDWLALLVARFEQTGAEAVGGPNLSPTGDGPLAACVAASPGQPTHVLLDDERAEHLPGCNLAVRRDALLALGGFDPRYRTAGDDVDVCWRLEDAGKTLAFAPGAFVWHHRRQTPRAFLRQQAGYGEAEALLLPHHPHRFNGRGEGRWRGFLYGGGVSAALPRLGRGHIRRGTFGAGLFQTLYQPGPAHAAMLLTTPEWHVVTLLGAAAVGSWGRSAPLGLLAAGILLVPALAIAGLRAAQARLPPAQAGLRSRLLIAALSYAQPLARGCARWRTRLLRRREEREETGARAEDATGQTPSCLPLTGRAETSYWSEARRERVELLQRLLERLAAPRGAGWTVRVDEDGWSRWDLSLQQHPWTVLRVGSVQEDHSKAKRLIRVRYRLRPALPTQAVLGLAGLCALLLGAGLLRSPGLVLAALAAPSFAALVWWRGTRLASKALALMDAAADDLGLLRTGSSSDRGKTNASHDHR